MANDYLTQLHRVWSHAVQAYRSGERDQARLFSDADRTFLASIGQNTQELFDYAEDFANGGDPDFTTMALVAEIRRRYFLEVQQGKLSGKTLDSSSLPAKTDETDGIVWLPRILPKARAKLRGELPPETMYGCGGDRRFFRENGLHPAELLLVVWQYGDNHAAIIDWVKSRRPVTV